MAPPPNRRSGYSRRAQYTTFFGYLAGVAGALLGAVILGVSIADPSSFAGLRSWGSDAAAPASRLAARGSAESKGVFESVRGYFAAGSQNAHLRRELAAAKAKLIEGQAQADENRRLKALLALSETGDKPVAYARLIGSTSSSARRFATLSAGAGNGITVGMPVRSPTGLVGRVLEVGTATSRVLLITDSESVVPVRRASDGIAGFAQGLADGTVQIKLNDLGINPLKRGDTLVTSGTGGLYRPGTPIAMVARLTRDGAIAQVLGNPAASEYVAVEPVWTPEAFEPVVRAAPKTAPTGQAASSAP
jgi:rod shape-determining protein MreC